MTAWTSRSREERNLLNPAFCANLVWHAARGYGGCGSGALSFEESFLVLPFVLHKHTRERLPRSSRTSLAAWLNEDPLVRERVAARARLLVPFTKEALLFGGVHGFIRLDGGRLYPEATWKKIVNRTLKESTDEVRDCAKRAEFLGRWFSEAGSPATILALIGVRP